MIKRFQNRLSAIAIVVVLIISIFYSYEYRVKDNAWTQIVNSDGRGYYAYLPAIFIFNDWNWDFVYEKEKIIIPSNPELLGDYINNVNGEKVNRYFIGTSILISPFFLLAYFLSYILGQQIDGYSFIFFYSVLIAAIFYFILGLNYVRKTLLLLNFSASTTALVVLGFGLGSNLFHYANYEPSMSHIYSFALIASFCYFSKKIALNYSNKTLLLLIVLFSLIVIVRPVNGLAIFALPFFFNTFSDFLLFVQTIIFKNLKTLFLGVLIFLFVISLQIAPYYLQAGKLWVYSYSEAKFNFSEPHFIDILFSYRKGLFVYTPILFISIFGFFILLKNNKYQVLIWFIFFMCTNYILSAWSFWWYGGSFGMRAYVEFFPFFMILFALAFSHSSWSKKVVAILTLLFIGLNFIQMYQYQNYIIHGVDMDKEKFWNIFLKTSDIYKGVFYAHPYNAEFQEYEGHVLLKSKNTMDEYDAYWATNGSIIEMENAFSGNKVSRVDTNQIFSEAFIYQVPSNLYKEYILRINAKYYLPSKKSRSSIVIDIANQGITKKYETYYTHNIFENTPLNQWLDHSISLKLSDIKKDDVIKVYYLNSGEEKSFLDDIEINLLEGTDYRREAQDENYYKTLILSNPDWLELVKQKAKKSGVEVDEMIRLDASYSANQEKEIVEIEHQIIENSEQFSSVKQSSLKENKSIKITLYEKALEAYLKK